MARRSRCPRATRATRCSWTGGRSPVSASRRSVGRAARRSSRGSRVRHDDEVVLGVDTADRLGVDLGDTVAGAVRHRLSGRSAAPAAVAARRRARDVRRHLAAGHGRGAARRRRARHPAHLRTAARLRREPARVDHRQPGRRHRPDGASSTPTPTASRTRSGVKTRWFTDARPAELLQLDEASPGARRCHRGRPPAPRRRARPGRLVADPSERRRAVGAPGPRVLPLPARPHRGVADRSAGPRRAWPSACRSGSPSVDSPSAPSPDRSRWWTTRARRPGSSWRWRWPSSCRSASARSWPARSRATSPAPPPSATPKAAAPDRPSRTAAEPTGSGVRPQCGVGGQDQVQGSVGSAAGSKRSRSCGHRHRLAGLGQAEAGRQPAADLVGVDALGGEVGEGDGAVALGEALAVGTEHRAARAPTSGAAGRAGRAGGPGSAWRRAGRRRAPPPPRPGRRRRPRRPRGTRARRRCGAARCRRPVAVTAPCSRSTIVTGSPSPRRRSAAGRPSASRSATSRGGERRDRCRGRRPGGACGAALASRISRRLQKHG